MVVEKPSWQKQIVILTVVFERRGVARNLNQESIQGSCG